MSVTPFPPDPKAVWTTFHQILSRSSTRSDPLPPWTSGSRDPTVALSYHPERRVPPVLNVGSVVRPDTRSGVVWGTRPHVPRSWQGL